MQHHPVFSVRTADTWHYVTAPFWLIYTAILLALVNVVVWGAVGLYEAVRLFV